MREAGTEVTIRHMTETRIQGAEIIVLDEFRLRAADAETGGAAARRVSVASRGARDSVPLLTSIDDPRDVATVRAVQADTPAAVGPRGDAALRELVSDWQPAKRYRPRIAERSGASSSFRLAVTESGINDEPVAAPSASVGEPAAAEPVSLLVVGVPEDTHAGLLVLVGRDDAESAGERRDGSRWPLPLSRDLGVRVYEGGGHTGPAR